MSAGKCCVFMSSFRLGVKPRQFKTCSYWIGSTVNSPPVAGSKECFCPGYVISSHIQISARVQFNLFLA